MSHKFRYDLTEQEHNSMLFIYFLIQILPDLVIESFFKLTPMSLRHSPKLLLVEYILCSSIKCFRLISYFPCLDLESVISPNSPSLFHWKQYFETRMWALEMLIATGALWLPGLLEELN